MVGDGLVVSLCALLAGLYAGLARGGLLRNLGTASLEWWGLLPAGVLLPVAVARSDPPRAVVLVVVSLVALVVFTIRNRQLAGMSIVAIGLSANLVVVVLNDGMPVQRDALVAAELATPEDVGRVEISGIQRLERDGDRLLFLGDVIPLPETQQVLSFGDLVILAGLADVAANLLLGRRRPADDAEEPSRTEPRQPGPGPDVARAPDPRGRPRRIADFEPVRVDEPTHVLVGAGTGVGPPR